MERAYTGDQHNTAKRCGRFTWSATHMDKERWEVKAWVEYEEGSQAQEEDG